MPLEKIGMNISNLNNITAPTFDIGNTSEEIIQEIPQKANELSGGWFGAITLGTIFTWLMWMLQKSEAEGGRFGFSTLRSMGIAFGTCAIIGIYGMNIGFFTNFYHVAIFIIGNFICVGLVWKSQA